MDATPAERLNRFVQTKVYDLPDSQIAVDLRAVLAELTALRASHDRLANVLGAISEAQAKYYGYGGPLHLAMISLAKEAREALAAIPPA